MGRNSTLTAGLSFNTGLVHEHPYLPGREVLLTFCLYSSMQLVMYKLSNFYHIGNFNYCLLFNFRPE